MLRLSVPNDGQLACTTEAQRRATLDAFLARTRGMELVELRIAGRTQRTNRKGRLEVTLQLWSECFTSGWPPHQIFSLYRNTSELIGDSPERLAILNQCVDLVDDA